MQEVIPLISPDIESAFWLYSTCLRVTKSLAERLDSMSGVNVKEAEDNEVVKMAMYNCGRFPYDY